MTHWPINYWPTSYWAGGYWLDAADADIFVVVAEKTVGPLELAVAEKTVSD